MKKLTIKSKIMFWYSGLLAVLLAILLPYMYYTMSQFMYRDAETVLRSDAVRAIEALEISPQFARFDEDIEAVSKETYIAIYSKDNKFLLGKLPLNIASKVKPTYRGLFKVENGNNEWLVLDVKIREDGKTVGWLRAVRSLNLVHQALKSLLFVFFIGIPVYIIIAVVGGFFIARGALSPIDYITKTAKQIGHGDLKKRIQLTHTHDEVGRLAETFDEMLDRLEESFNREKQFASDASHELKTPVAVIMLHAEEALDGVKSEDEYKESMQTILSESQKMRLMINQLLMLARGREGKLAPQMESVDLSFSAASIAAEMSIAAQKSGIEIITEIEDKIISTADQTLMTRLLINLIDNAIKYNHPGGWVKVTLTNEKTHVRLSVKDNGMGISNEDLPNIWNRFYRADKSHTGSGSGLGLSIVKWIVDAHGGIITVKSEIGHGTEFEIKLKKNEKD